MDHSRHKPKCVNPQENEATDSQVNQRSRRRQAMQKYTKAATGAGASSHGSSPWPLTAARA